ncbi:sugar ABC transporter substrate-binding protein [Hominifimenecus sp. rT4P-3]|uniref:sugar ABC transporter substrate-binding protein n=1 Tax=Hominifimenecus sp. rT4P-3 TaxID=3242979 RepID=UPI003DA663F0
MKKLRKALAIVLSMSMVFGLVGCGSSNDTTTSAAGATTAAAAETTAASEAGSTMVETAANQVGTEDCVIGLSILSMAAEFLIAMVQGAQDKADELGVELIVRDCNVNNQTQVDQILDMINQGVSCIIVEPWDSEGISVAIDAATEAGIPVFTVDTSGNSKDIKCWVASDNMEMGRMAGEYIAEYLKEKNGSYSGKVVNLMASLTSTSGTNRSAGFHEVIDQYPDIQIVEQNADLEVEKALNTMTDILQANDDIDAVWCSGDNNAIGVIQAIDAANRYYPQGEDDHILVVSADGGMEILDNIRKGKCDACISQQPITMGADAVQMAYDYVVNKVEPKSDVQYVGLFNITTENIDSKELAEFGLWAEQVR